MPNIQVHMTSEPIAPAMRGRPSEGQDFSDALMAKHDKTASPAHLAAGDANPGGLSKEPDDRAVPPTNEMPRSKGASAFDSRDVGTVDDSDSSEIGLVTGRPFSEVPASLLGLPTGSTDQAVTWSRVLGQHLIANDYLSVVEVAGRNQSEHETLLEMSESQTAVPMVDGEFSPVSSVAMQVREIGSQAGVLPIAHVVEDSEPDSGSARAAHDVSSVGLENFLVPDRLWAKRVLKLTRDPAGGCTAWVRDFDLCENEVQALAVSLKRHASLQDVPLNRIVVNGREVWRATEQENS